MVFVTALLIFLGITTAVWVVGLALYNSFVGPNLFKNPAFWPTTGFILFMVSFLGFVPAPYGYLLSLVVWWLAAQVLFQLTFFRALALFLILGALSFLERMAVLGILQSF